MHAQLQQLGGNRAGEPFPKQVQQSGGDGSTGGVCEECEMSGCRGSTAGHANWLAREEASRFESVSKCRWPLTDVGIAQLGTRCCVCVTRFDGCRQKRRGGWNAASGPARAHWPRRASFVCVCQDQFSFFSFSFLVFKGDGMAPNRTRFDCFTRRRRWRRSEQDRTGQDGQTACFVFSKVLFWCAVSFAFLAERLFS